LRHTNACHLLQGTWVPKLHARPLTLIELKHWLGHSSILVTEKHYARLAPGNLHDAVRLAKPKIERNSTGDDT
jgi:integrase